MNCSQAYADLASGLLADATGYFLRSTRATSPEARDLWRAAAAMLVGLARKDMDTLKGCIAAASPDANVWNATAFSHQGDDSAICAQYCLYAAELAEKYPFTPNDVAPATNALSAAGAVAAERVERCSVPQLSRAMVKLMTAVVLNTDSWVKTTLLRPAWEAFSLVRHRAETGPFPPSYLVALGVSLQPGKRDELEWLGGCLLTLLELVGKYPSTAWDNNFVCFTTLWSAVRQFTSAVQQNTGARAVAREGRRCERLLHALAAGLAERCTERGLWLRASEVESQAPASGYDVFINLLGDNLVRAAWEERANTGVIPARLLAYPHGAPDGFSYTDLVSISTEAEVTQIKHSRVRRSTAHAQGLQRRAMEQFACATTFPKGCIGGMYALDTAPERCQQLTGRALRSGRCFALAAEAVNHGNDAIWRLYLRAAELSYSAAEADSAADPQPLQTIADKASDLYMKTAIAVAAKNTVLQPLLGACVGYEEGQGVRTRVGDEIQRASTGCGGGARSRGGSCGGYGNPRSGGRTGGPMCAGSIDCTGHTDRAGYRGGGGCACRTYCGCVFSANASD